MIITLSSKVEHHPSERSSTPSFILHEKAREYYWSGQSPLSVKMFFGGRALYTIGQGYYAVDDYGYLIVNHDQSYTIEIEAERAVESFCVFFEHGFAEEVYRSMVLPASTLLAEPITSRIDSLSFFARTYMHDEAVSSRMFALRAMMAKGSSTLQDLWLYECLTQVMLGLLQGRQNVLLEIEMLPALRAATRAEVYRRLYMAREYIVAFYDRPLTVPELAGVASLSPSHFLRLFKQLFRQTPHHYVIDLRLKRAQRLLQETDQPVTEICFALGFESPGSFSGLFRQHVGCSPTEFRRRKK